MGYGNIQRLALATGLAVGLILNGSQSTLAQTSCDTFTTYHLIRSPGSQLLLTTTAPTGATANFEDSAGLATAGGNPWRPIGEWETTGAGVGCFLVSLGNLQTFIGLQNSDDQGTKFDLLAEVLADGVTVSSGEVRCISGVTKNPAKATPVTIALSDPGFTFIDATIGLRVSARIGTPKSVGGRCSGHTGATGVRLYYDAANRDSQFDAQLSPSGCFAAGTKVVMGDGSQKPIESLKVGDEVRSYDFKADKVVTSRVSKMHQQQVPGYMVLNDGLKVTATHPFATGPDSWKRAGLLKAGDKVIGNSFTEIKKVEKVVTPTEVFNLTVDGTHTFYVTDGTSVFLVHNK
jgi:hypothetical protein